jgi:hypothetical protein
VTSPGTGGPAGRGSGLRSLETTLIIVGMGVLLLIGYFLGHFGARSDLAGLLGRLVSENGSLLILAGVALAALGACLFSGRGSQVAAVLRTSLKEILRGGSLWLALLVAAVVAVGAPFLEAEGGAPGRVKMILSVAAGAASAVGTLLAVALPSLTFSREMETRSIYVTATKPVPRWVLYTGKLLGVGLALGGALAVLGVGAFVAGGAALVGEASRAERRGQNPDHVWLTAYYSRVDARPRLQRLPGGGWPKPEIFYRGQKLSFSTEVPEEALEGDWVVVRVHAGPANPRIQTAPARVHCGGAVYPVNVDRSIPVDLVVPASAVRKGRLVAELEPVLDVEGINRGLRTDPRGTVALAVRGDGLGGMLAKTLGMIWLQLLVIAAVTLTAASVLSFPVAVVSGVTAAITGHLSGLAVGILRHALAVGKHMAAKSGGGATGAGGEALEEVSPLGQLVRQEAAGLISILPDFDAASTADFLASGSYVPWRFITAGVLSLLVFRTVPVAVLGCWVFSRKEVGA